MTTTIQPISTAKRRKAEQNQSTSRQRRAKSGQIKSSQSAAVSQLKLNAISEGIHYVSTQKKLALIVISLWLLSGTL